jgi:hypothetical protein
MKKIFNCVLLRRKQRVQFSKSLSFVSVLLSIPFNKLPCPGLFNPRLFKHELFNPLLKKFMVTEFMVEMSCNCFEEEESTETNIVQMLSEPEKIINTIKQSEMEEVIGESEAELQLRKEAKQKEMEVLKMMQMLKK